MPAKTKKKDEEEKVEEKTEEKAEVEQHHLDTHGSFTYVDNRLAGSVHDILWMFENALNGVRPLPIEWLADSLQAGSPVDATNYLPENEQPEPPPEEVEEKE